MDGYGTVLLASEVLRFSSKTTALLLKREERHALQGCITLDDVFVIKNTREDDPHPLQLITAGRLGEPKYRRRGQRKHHSPNW